MQHLMKGPQPSIPNGLNCPENGGDIDDSVEFMETAMEQELRCAHPMQQSHSCAIPADCMAMHPQSVSLHAACEDDSFNDTESSRHPCVAWDCGAEETRLRAEPASSCMQPQPGVPSQAEPENEVDSVAMFPQPDTSSRHNVHHRRRYQPPASTWLQRSDCDQDRLSDIPESPWQPGSPAWQPNPLSDAGNVEFALADQQSADLAELDTNAPGHVWQPVNPLCEAGEWFLTGRCEGVEDMEMFQLAHQMQSPAMQHKSLVIHASRPHVHSVAGSDSE